MQIIIKGDRIDPDLLEKFGQNLQNQLHNIDNNMREIINSYVGPDVASSMNLKSNKQLSDFCISYLGLHRALNNKKFVTSTGMLSLSDDTIPHIIDTYTKPNSLARRFLQLLLEKHKAEKQYTSYYIPYKKLLEYLTPDEDGMYFIHPSIDTAGTVTGRVSTKNPNTQQLPKGGFVRRLFISRYPEGYILSMDYSQAEVRVLGLVTQDPKLIDTFKNRLDPYKTLATVVFNKEYKDVTKEERTICKPLMLAALYGMSPRSLAVRLNITPEDAQNKYNLFMRGFSGIKRYHKFLNELVVKYGYVYGATYRRRNFGLIERAIKDGKSQAEIEELAKSFWTKIINAPIQGATSDMALYNFSLLARAVIEHDLDATWMLTVHDSIVFDVADFKTAEKIVELAGGILPKLHPAMVDYMNTHYPNGWEPIEMAFDAEIGRNYGKYDPDNNPAGVIDFVAAKEQYYG